jgi:hypothetical protein
VNAASLRKGPDGVLKASEGVDPPTALVGFPRKGPQRVEDVRGVGSAASASSVLVVVI